jgi:hypothetical protein
MGEQVFKVGDVVSVSPGYSQWDNVDAYANAPKTNGRVIKAFPVSALVQFDGWTWGHTGGRGEGAARDCWYIAHDYLEVCPEFPAAAPEAPEVPTPTPVITLYPSDLLILKHLRARGSISPMEALVSHGCARLAPRIFNLRKAGHEITTELLTDEGGHRYSRYTLQKEAA